MRRRSTLWSETEHARLQRMQPPEAHDRRSATAGMVATAPPVTAETRAPPSGGVFDSAKPTPTDGTVEGPTFEGVAKWAFHENRC